MINRKNISVAILLFCLTITNRSIAQVRDTILLKKISKVLKIQPEQAAKLAQPDNSGKAFIFSFIIAVNSSGKADYIKFNSTPEISKLFEGSQFEKKIKEIDFLKYKNRKLWFPFLLKNMNDDSIKNGLHREFDLQWQNLIPVDLAKITPKRKLTLFAPEIYSYKSLPPKIVN